MLQHISDISQCRWMEAYNDSGEEIPAFGACRIEDMKPDNLALMKLKKPNGDGQNVCIAGPVPIQEESTGTITRDFPCWALYDTADGTPTVGGVWGTANGTFRLKKDKPGYEVLGVDAITNRIWIVPKFTGGTGGGSPLTVEEVDGSPSVTNVTKIQVDQDDGLQVIQVAPGVARIDFTGLLTVKEEDGSPTITNVHTIVLRSPNLSVASGGPGIAIIDTVGYSGPYVVDVICNGDGTITVTKRTMVKGVGK